MKRVVILLAGVGLAVWLTGCATTGGRRGAAPAANDARWKTLKMVITGYCPCGECCNWRRTWYGRPVIASGPRAGRPKDVGITASGRAARAGTIAADPKVLPLGTQLYVPGYGYGTVEDTGGAIQGRRLDLFFSTHERARQWGIQRLPVRVRAR